MIKFRSTFQTKQSFNQPQQYFFIPIRFIQDHIANSFNHTRSNQHITMSQLLAQTISESLAGKTTSEYLNSVGTNSAIGNILRPRGATQDWSDAMFDELYFKPIWNQVFSRSSMLRAYNHAMILESVFMGNIYDSEEILKSALSVLSYVREFNNLYHVIPEALL